MGGYRRDIANLVLAQGYGVEVHVVHADSDFEECAYIRALPGGKKAMCLMSFEIGLAAYPPDMLKRVCEEIGLAREFDAIRRRVMDLGGWVGRGP